MTGGLITAFLSEIYFLSPVTIYIPSVQAIRLNAIRYTEIYSVASVFPGINILQMGIPINPTLPTAVANTYILRLDGILSYEKISLATRNITICVSAARKKTIVILIISPDVNSLVINELIVMNG